jgi:hypothetical protein
LECNTLQQPFVETPKRLKSQQMLDFFASPPSRRVPDYGQVNKFDRQSPGGHPEPGWFLEK